MQVKSLVIFILSSLLALNVFAQKLEDVVYLNNGSIIRGRILEMIPNEYVKIEIAGGSVLVYKADEILKMSKEEVYKSSKPYDPKTKGFFTQSTVGFSVGDGYYYNPMSVSLNVNSGYKWKNRIHAGLSSGFDFLYIPSIPLMATVKWDIFDSRVSPYIGVFGGFLLPLDGKTVEKWQYNYTGGYLINPIIGFRNYFNNNTALDFGFGFRRAELYSNRYDEYYKVTVERTEVANRIYFSVGFIFK